MAYPVFKNSYGVSAADDDLVSTYLPTTPSGIDIDDIIIAAVMDADNDTFTTPTGWNYITSDSTSSNLSVYWFWGRVVEKVSGTATSDLNNKLYDSTATFITDGVSKGDRAERVSDGGGSTIQQVTSEVELALASDAFPNGNEEYSILGVGAGSSNTFVSALTAGSLVAAVTYGFSGCKTTGTPFEDATIVNVAQDTTVASALITTEGTERLACCFITVEDNVSVTGHSNYTDANYKSTTWGSDAAFNLATQEKATAGDVSAETFTLGGDDYAGTLTLALIPADSATPFIPTLTIY